MLGTIWVFYTSDPAQPNNKVQRVEHYFNGIFIYLLCYTCGKIIISLANKDSKYCKDLLLFAQGGLSILSSLFMYLAANQNYLKNEL